MRAVASGCEKYLKAYFNEDFFDFELNGESFVLRAYAQSVATRSASVWDVGANEGSWAIAANNAVPQAEVTSFEIVPAVYQRLQATASRHPWLTPLNLGLSDRVGDVIVHFNPTFDTTSSIEPRLGHGLFAGDVHTLKCQVTTGDELVFTQGIAPPDFLKIDVEGHEAAVLRGCESLVASDKAPRLIQFEYGETNLPAGSTLGDIYALLEPHGYSIGRIYPNYVAFKSYDLKDDHFRMGNYVAVKDPILHRMLS